MPSCLGTSGLVRTVAKPQRLTWAPDVHTFWPLTSQPPSTLVALVFTPAASEPASGSLKSWHQIHSWRRVGGTQRCTWSSSPCWIRVRITQPVMPYAGFFTPAAANSSSMTSCSTGLASRPQGFGQWGAT